MKGEQMRETNRPLFRTGAMQRYAQRKEKVSLLRFLSPRLFFYLWTLLGLLLLCGFGLWFVYANSI
jgi:hypothetical protein